MTKTQSKFLINDAQGFQDDFPPYGPTNKELIAHCRGTTADPYTQTKVLSAAAMTELCNRLEVADKVLAEKNAEIRTLRNYGIISLEQLEQKDAEIKKLKHFIKNIGYIPPELYQQKVKEILGE